MRPRRGRDGPRSVSLRPCGSSRCWRPWWRSCSPPRSAGVRPDAGGSTWPCGAIALLMYAGRLGGGCGGRRRRMEPIALRGVLDPRRRAERPAPGGRRTDLLVRNEAFRLAVWLVLVFLTAATVATLRGAAFDPAALAERLPSGKDVFGDGARPVPLPSSSRSRPTSSWWRARCGRPGACEADPICVTAPSAPC